MSTQSEHVPETPEEKGKRKSAEKKKRAELKEISRPTVRKYQQQFIAANNDVARDAVIRFAYAELGRPEVPYAMMKSQFHIMRNRLSGARGVDVEQQEPMVTAPQKPVEPEILVQETKVAPPIPALGPLPIISSKADEMAKWQDDILHLIQTNAAMQKQETQRLVDEAVSSERTKYVNTMITATAPYKERIAELEAQLPAPRRGRPPKTETPQNVQPRTQEYIPPQNDMVEPEEDPPDLIPTATTNDGLKLGADEEGNVIQYRQGDTVHTVTNTGRVVPLFEVVGKVVTADPYRLVLFEAWKAKHHYTKGFAQALLEAFDYFMEERGVDLQYVEKIRKRPGDGRGGYSLQEAQHQLMREQFPAEE